MTTVAWLGPVNLAQVKGASVPGLPTVNLTCTGDGAPSCGQLADSWLSGGRRLPGLLRRFDLPASEPLILGAFSAGGHIVKRLCLSGEDRAQIDAVLLSDATYTNDLKADGSAAPIPGLVDYALDCLSKRKLFVATASGWPNKNWPSGEKTLLAVRDEIERRTGRAFEATEFPTSPAPEQAWRLDGVGTILFATYGSKVSHAGHATDLAPQIWPAVLTPWMEGESESGPYLIALAVGSALGYVGMRALFRRWGQSS